MNKVKDVISAVVATTALIMLPTAGWATTAELSLSDSSVLLGSSTGISGVVSLHNSSAAIDGNVTVTGTLPGGFVLNDVQIYPTALIGEEVWNDNGETRLLTTDLRNGDRLDELMLIPIGTTSGDPCGIFGFDMHPVTGEYYVLMGMMPPGGTCSSDESTIRDLYKVDPITGTAILIGSPTFVMNGIFFTPDGRLFGHGANASARRGGLVEMSTVDASTKMFVGSPIPDAAVTWNDPAMAGSNPETGLIYHFYECQMATTNPSTKAQSSVQSVAGSDCPNNGYTAVTYIGNSKFLIWDWDDFQTYDVGTKEWVYLSSGDRAKGAVGSGGTQTDLAACTFTDTSFTCTVPRVIPRGRYSIEFDGTFSANAIGAANFNVGVNGVNTSQVVNVVGADLKATASANLARVDQTDNVVWTLEAENVGSAAANSTQLVIQIPANQTYSSYSTISGSCSLASQTLTCNVGTVQPGNLGRIVLVTTANADGISDLTVDVSTSSNELSATNNSADTRVVVGPAADLAVSASRPASKDGTSPTDMPGKPMEMTFTVANAGPNDAVDATLYHTLPANLTLSSAKASQGTCTVSGGKLTCALGTIAVDKAATVTLSPTATLAGAYALTITAEALSTPDMNLANNETVLKLNVLPPSLQVAGGKSLGSVSGEKASLAQLVLTHGGQTEQALAVKALTFEGNFSGLNLEKVRVLVIDDADGNGRADAQEGMLGTGDITVDGLAATVRLAGDGIELKKGETKTVVIVLRDSVSTQIASVNSGTVYAMFGLLPLALLFGLRRRNGLPLLVIGMVFFGSAACSEEATEAGAKIQLTLTAVDVELAEGPSPAAPVEGLPLKLPTVEVK